MLFVYRIAFWLLCLNIFSRVISELWISQWISLPHLHLNWILNHSRLNEVGVFFDSSLEKKEQCLLCCLSSSKTSFLKLTYFLYSCTLLYTNILKWLFACVQQWESCSSYLRGKCGSEWSIEFEYWICIFTANCLVLYVCTVLKERISSVCVSLLPF